MQSFVYKCKNYNFFSHLARKRQIALNEVQRLKREGTLRPTNTESPGGILSISAITLSLKPEYMDLGKCKVMYNFVV